MFTWTVAIKRHKVSQYCKSLPKLMLGVKKLVTSSFKRKIAWIFLACEQQTFLLCSSPLRDVLWGGTSATQQQKFHNDDVNQCLHNKSGSHGVPNVNLFNFMFLLSILVKCCVPLRMSASKTQMLLEKTIFHKYWLFC